MRQTHESQPKNILKIVISNKADVPESEQQASQTES